MLWWRQILIFARSQILMNKLERVHYRALKFVYQRYLWGATNPKWSEPLLSTWFYIHLKPSSSTYAFRYSRLRDSTVHEGMQSLSNGLQEGCVGCVILRLLDGIIMKPSPGSYISGNFIEYHMIELPPWHDYRNSRFSHTLRLIYQQST